MRPWRPNILLIAAGLVAIIIVDMLSNGDKEVALVAAGALAATLAEIARRGD